MKQNIEELQVRFTAGERLKYLFFSGHTPGHGQAVGPFVFSQWYPAEFTINGVVYKTAEHWMMAEKARLFSDRKLKKKL